MIQIKNIKKVFNSKTLDENKLFDNFSLDIKKGEFLSIIGSNGSGKSTLLNIICGGIFPDNGQIIMNGQDISNQKDFVRAKRIGRVMQDPKLGTCGELTILENLELANNKGKKFGISSSSNKKNVEKYKEMLKMCEMGLENRLHAKVGLLSGGQRQALALIIANLSDIDVLILDEHTAALDPKSSENIMKLTKKLVEHKKITTIMVTHNLRHAIEYGDSMIMMHEGKIVKRFDDKNSVEMADILKIFNEISIECGN